MVNGRDPNAESDDLDGLDGCRGITVGALIIVAVILAVLVLRACT
jgi:hypothetical protein